MSMDYGIRKKSAAPLDNDKNEENLQEFRDMIRICKVTGNIFGGLHYIIDHLYILSGDQDSVIPLTGSRTLVQKLEKELGLNSIVPYRVWFEGKQVGGWTLVHGDMLTFATIRGASHEAPFSQPARSLGLFRAFLANRPLHEAF